MRADMIAGLRRMADARHRVATRSSTSSTTQGWRLEARRAPLGVVAFVFEGRPNVFADACGVLRSGNAVVFRIGSDALGTARAIVEHALRPPSSGSGSARSVPCSSSSRPRAAPVTRCSAIAGSRSPSPAGRVPRSRNSVPWRRRPGFRSACTAPVAHGSWPASHVIPRRCGAAVRTRSTARCATRSTACVILRSRRRSAGPGRARRARARPATPAGPTLVSTSSRGAESSCPTELFDTVVDDRSRRRARSTNRWLRRCPRTTWPSSGNGRTARRSRSWSSTRSTRASTCSTVTARTSSRR